MALYIVLLKPQRLKQVIYNNALRNTLIQARIEIANRFSNSWEIPNNLLIGCLKIQLVRNLGSDIIKIGN
jgi:hypothetical protein